MSRNDRGPLSHGSRPFARAGVCFGLCTLGLSGGVRADSLELPGDINAEYRASATYSLALRTQGPAQQLVDGGTGASGFPAAVNGDDGDRNFSSWSAINNRLSTYAELNLKRDSYGIFTSGSAFYDLAYRSHNDNNSPATVNKTGDNQEFTDGARYFDGRRARFLDAYAYGSWNFGEASGLTVKAGRQVVSWGESLFFEGIASVQNPADATKASVPGVELRDVLLPSNQILFQFNVNDWLGLMAYYKFQFAPTELSPVGDFFSTTDIIGPGGSFLYVLANPLYGTFGQVVPGTPATITAQRGADQRAPDHGEFGLSSTFQITDRTSSSLYYLHYHENTPEVVIHYSAPNSVSLLPAVPLTSQTPAQEQTASAFLQASQGMPAAEAAVVAPIFLSQGVTVPTALPATYNVVYFDNVDLYGASVSSGFGPVQVSGEYSFRHKASILVNPAAPTATRGDVSQGLASVLYSGGPSMFWQSTSIAAELGYVHLHDVDAAGGSDVLVNSRNSYGYSILAQFSYPNAIPGWDAMISTSFQELLKGPSALSGAFGSLAGKDDRRASVGFTVTRLGALELGLSYNMFIGSPDLVNRPLADRDNLALSVKYSL